MNLRPHCRSSRVADSATLMPSARKRLVLFNLEERPLAVQSSTAPRMFVMEFSRQKQLSPSSTPLKHYRPWVTRMHARDLEGSAIDECPEVDPKLDEVARLHLASVHRC